MSFGARGEEHDAVRGERREALVHAGSSLQSRLSGALALGLMLLLGLCALSWYYAHAFKREDRARAAAQAQVNERARGEMPLPSLGPIAAPEALPPVAAAEAAATSGPVGAASELPLAEAPAQPASAPAGVPAAGVATRGEPVSDRRLGGAVFTRAADSGAGPSAGTAPEAGQPGTAPPAARGAAADDALAALLQTRTSAAVSAQMLPTQRLLLPKGAFIDCTLETAIDSTLPGMTTCITAADTFGADGKVVLLERGTKLVGETRGQVTQGQARVFVAWSQARTPTGVIVPLDSPGTDELGRAGLPGEVEHHFWQRFGAALLISIVDGAVQAGVQSTNRSGGTVLYAPSSSQDILTEVLKGTVNIAPTVIKRNGDRIQVLVARDVDFRPVYELRTTVR